MSVESVDTAQSTCNLFGVLVRALTSKVILFRNFQLLVCCGLLHQLFVTEISDAFCHSVVCPVLPTCCST
jgi:hypothetical protein